jgi:serine/threonine-protein kinase
MKITMPFVTLVSGAAVGAAVFIASMLSTSGAPPVRNQAATSPEPAATDVVMLPPPASSGVVVTLPSSASSVATATPAAATTAPPAAATTAPPAAATAAPPATGPANAPANADYAAQADGGGASVAVSVHGNQAVAYVCDGHNVGEWYHGTAKAGKLDLTGARGARLTVTYRDASAAGYAMADGRRYRFSAPALHGRYGLYESTAVVHGTRVKAGWIVLPDGYQVGAMQSSPAATVPSVTPAPELDLATGTAQYDGVVLIATLISGVTGSGF